MESLSKKQIRLHIATEHASQEVEGTWYIRDDTHYISYIEPETNEMGHARTTWKIPVALSQATLIRHGDVQMKLEFELGEDTHNQMVTPYGSWPSVVRTETLHHHIHGAGGRLRVHYQIELHGDVLPNRVEIHWETIPTEGA